jgi:selenide,water dikinase
MADSTGGAPVRLTRFSHGGGCGCKISPAVLRDLLSRMPHGIVPPELLVGAETADDAAVWRLNDTQALIATTDFFLPIVDDPFDFGRIAAANALSDVYAMGGRPILALSLLGMPIDKLPPEAIGKVLAGGAAVCAQAGIPIAGGHSIDSVEPIYGLVALGLVHPGCVKKNRSAKPGDVLVLGKPLGIGILSAALKNGKLSAEGYATMIRHTTQLNSIGTALGGQLAVHALTDVTGFGLLGHLLEICRAGNCRAHIDFNALPLLPAAVALAQMGVQTGASARNWQAYGEEVQLFDGIAPWQQALLTDPQTSGGLLAACDPGFADEAVAIFRAAGFKEAAAIGKLEAWEGGAKAVVR